MSKKSITAPVDPRDDDAPIGHAHGIDDTIEEETTEREEQEDQEEEDDTDYDILPSNGPGLVGDDGEEVLPADEDDA